LAAEAGHTRSPRHSRSPHTLLSEATAAAARTPAPVTTAATVARRHHRRQATPAHTHTPDTPTRSRRSHYYSRQRWHPPAETEIVVSAMTVARPLKAASPGWVDTQRQRWGAAAPAAAARLAVLAARSVGAAMASVVPEAERADHNTRNTPLHLADPVQAGVHTSMPNNHTLVRARVRDGMGEADAYAPAGAAGSDVDGGAHTDRTPADGGKATLVAARS
jgi:hypothetical protein